MGWLAFLLLAAAVLVGLLWRVRPSRQAAMALASALMLGGVGYAWQGRPLLAGAPARAASGRPFTDPLFTAERKIWLESVGPDADLLASADTLIAGGSADYAVGVLRGATMRAPQDMVAWIGLGHALAAYADGVVTPAARFCYARAAAIAPRHPAPHYFLGLALLVAGDLDGAEAEWRALLADLPPDGAPHRLLERRVATVDELRAALKR